MKNICLHFQLHQPFRLRNYRFLQVGHRHDYFNTDTNREIIKKLTKHCYLPTNKILLELLKVFEGKLKLSFSISGTALEQFESFAPEVLESFNKLSNTGCVEFVAETFYYSLSSVKSKEEFKHQVNKHRQAVKRLLDFEPQVFKNTGLIYHNEIGQIISEMGFKGMIIDGSKRVLRNHSPNFVYKSKGRPSLKLLFRNTGLSDDINLHFFDKNWQEWPLTAGKLKKWIGLMPKYEKIIFLQLRYEIFGNERDRDNSVTNFIKEIPKILLPENKFVSPSEACTKIKPKAILNILNQSHDSEKTQGTWAWLGNDLQQDAFENIYQLEPSVIECKDEQLIRDWRLLQTADHFYYMNTNHPNGSKNLDFFSPYNSPYEAYINYMNAVNDLRGRIDMGFKPN